MYYSDNRYVQGILSTEVHTVWDEVFPMLELVISPDEYSIDDVLNELQKKEMQLWVAYQDGKIEAIMTTRLVDYPQGSFCVLVHMAGKWEQGLTQYLDHIGAWAKENGAKKFVIYGRAGWEKVLRGIFNKRAIVLEAAL